MSRAELPFRRVLVALAIVLASVVARALGLSESADLLGGVASRGVAALPLGLAVLVAHASAWIVAPVLALSATLSVGGTLVRARRSRSGEARPTVPT